MHRPYAGLYNSNEELFSTLFKLMDEKVIVVTARKFEYEPHTITVNKGDRVLIKLLPEDVTHGMYIDGYEKYVTRYIDRDGQIVPPETADYHIMPGEMGVVRFVADMAGRFTIRCAATCSAYHPYMIGFLRVEPNRRFRIAVIVTILSALVFTIIFAKHRNRNRILGLFNVDARYELTKFSIIRKMCKNRWFPLIGIIFNLFFFTVILMACLVGGVSAGNYNFGIMLVWILWYALLMMMLVPFFSRIWCGVCPLPFFGDWFQRFAILKKGRNKLFSLNKKWPKALSNMWIVNFLFIGTTFANGFLTTRPIATFIMFMIIIVMATVIALIYQKRTFCLYLCPVGGFQGLYANMALTEIRAKDQAVCKGHTPKTCVIGTEDGYACPWMESPFKMKRNTYCGMCLECFKTCPHDNMVVNIRPPGVDILVDEKRGLDESWKAFIMLGCAIVFYIFMMGPWGFLKDWQRAKTGIGFIKYIVSHSIFTLVLMPAIFAAFVYASRRLLRNGSISFKRMFVNYSYTLLPIGLLTWIGFSFGFLLPNGSYVLGVISDPFAWGWNLFGTANIPWTPFLTAWTPYLQMACVIGGMIFSIDIAIKLSQQMFSDNRQAIRSSLPIILYHLILAVGLLWMFAG